MRSIAGLMTVIGGVVTVSVTGSPYWSPPLEVAVLVKLVSGAVVLQT